MAHKHPAQNAGTQRHGQPAHLRGVSLKIVPANKVLFAGTVPENNLYEYELYYMRR